MRESIVMCSESVGMGAMQLACSEKQQVGGWWQNTAAYTAAVQWYVKDWKQSVKGEEFMKWMAFDKALPLV